MPSKKQSKDKRPKTLWEPVEATPEQIALACMQGSPKKNWDYQRKKFTLADEEAMPNGQR